MNFSTSEFSPNRQRCRQWIPLITQQFRLRHLCQFIGVNLSANSYGSFYFTLHLTTMCAPFYTSEKISNPHPRWKELDSIEMPNTSASCSVIRVWHHSNNESDQVVLTWGVHLSGLVYIGNKISDIQPQYFKTNTVIFNMFGGYYTSLQLIKMDLEKPIPFLNNLNAIDILNDKVIYKRVAMKCHPIETQVSYTVDKLKKVQNLQIQIKRRSSEVHNIQEKINVYLNGINFERDNIHLDENINSSIRYAPQLLTMNSLNKMLQEKPTRMEKQEMNKVSKDIEFTKFRIKLLSQEKDKKSVTNRQLKQKYMSFLEENEERNSILMENYHKLSRGAEKLREYKRDIIHHREILSQMFAQLHHRRKQLLQELLFIYPIEKVDDNKYSILNIYLPTSDKLADCNDIGLSVALGYITHILTMCSTFLQVPLRYPLTHYGSRSYVTDCISPTLADKDREFPLYTRGKDKVQFTYAVYLLNKNIAQFRWLLSMNTHDLKVTLSNLLTLLQVQRESRRESVGRSEISLHKKITFNLSSSEKYVGLHSFGSNSNISDPILDSIRNDNHLQRLSSPTKSQTKKASSKSNSRSSECGKSLSEILTIPEAYLNKQITSDSLRNYIVSGKCLVGANQGYNHHDNVPETFPRHHINITNGKEIGTTCDKILDSLNIEEGTDTLDPKSNLNSATQPLDICDNQPPRTNSSDNLIKQHRRLSRSVGSYSDDEYSVLTKPVFELGSEPLLNSSAQSENQRFEATLMENSQTKIIQKWLENAPSSSSENIFPSDISLNASPKQNNPLTARTDALLTRKSFNLVKSKPS